MLSRVEKISSTTLATITRETTKTIIRLCNYGTEKSLEVWIDGRPPEETEGVIYDGRVEVNFTTIKTEIEDDSR